VNVSRTTGAARRLTDFFFGAGLVFMSVIMSDIGMCRKTPFSHPAL
jgi:hypothetical protein